MQTFEKGNKDLSKFTWVTKSKNWCKIENDIAISIARASGNCKRERAMVHFHNFAAKRISNSNYVMFGIDGDRLYFAESDSTSGFKMSAKCEDKRMATSQISDDKFVEWAREHRGEYTLHQDAGSGLYYIDTRRLI